MCQKYQIWVVRHKFGVFELWSRGVWGPALKAPNGFRGKAPENTWLFDSYKALESI